jgi:hypothetical protein
MWIEVNGREYSDIFTVPAGRHIEKTIEATAVDGKLNVLFEKGASADWYAGSLVITRVDPIIAHIPIRRLAPDEDLHLRATLAGVTPIANMRVHYGDLAHGFSTLELEGPGPLYHVTIPTSKITEGTSYFLEATDSAGRISTFPEHGRSHLVSIMVTADNKPPVLHHTALVSTDPLGPLHITAQVDDPSGVKWVRLPASASIRTIKH